MDGPKIEALADLFPPGPMAVCVGVNPAPPSVAAGHYFQGRQGQRFFARLRQVGLLPEATEGFEDDAALAAGIGFTDVVKRPTARAADVTPEERRHGAERLREKMEAIQAPLLIFPFKDAAVALVGKFHGNGWLDQTFAGADLFVMPGPYEAKATANATLETLHDDSCERIRERHAAVIDALHHLARTTHQAVCGGECAARPGRL